MTETTEYVRKRCWAVKYPNQESNREAEGGDNNLGNLNSSWGHKKVILCQQSSEPLVADLASPTFIQALLLNVCPRVDNKFLQWEVRSVTCLCFSQYLWGLSDMRCFFIYYCSERNLTSFSHYGTREGPLLWLCVRFGASWILFPTSQRPPWASVSTLRVIRGRPGLTVFHAFLLDQTSHLLSSEAKAKSNQPKKGEWGSNLI